MSAAITSPTALNTAYSRLSHTSSPGAYIWRGDLTEGFLRYRFGGLYLEGLIFGILRYFTTTNINTTSTNISASKIPPYVALLTFYNKPLYNEVHDITNDFLYLSSSKIP